MVDSLVFLRLYFFFGAQAGGILTGKHSFDNPPEGGRFSSKTVWGGRYRQVATIDPRVFSLLRETSTVFSQFSLKCVAVVRVAAIGMPPGFCLAHCISGAFSQSFTQMSARSPSLSWVPTSCNAFFTPHRDRFWHKPTFDALDEIKALCQKHETTAVSASLRWLHHHSCLSGRFNALRVLCRGCAIPTYSTKLVAEICSSRVVVVAAHREQIKPPTPIIPLSTTQGSPIIPPTSALILAASLSIPGEQGDAVIVCGSSLDQVKTNVDACADERPLPQVGRCKECKVALGDVGIGVQNGGDAP